MIRGNISGPLSINIERDDFIAAAPLFSPGCGVAHARNRRLLFVALIRIDITIASPLGAKHVLEDSGSRILGSEMRLAHSSPPRLIFIVALS
jgi:hypothetical protein